MRILTTSLCFVALSTGAFAQQRPAYLIAEYEVIDAASMKKFGEASNPIVKAHGGHFVARLGPTGHANRQSGARANYRSVRRGFGAAGYIFPGHAPR